MSNMTILRARKELEMDVDLEHSTEVTNIDYEDGYMTLYGTETDEGELYYIVLDQATINRIGRHIRR